LHALQPVAKPLAGNLSCNKMGLLSCVLLR
jgi:hypothetical protein